MPNAIDLLRADHQRLREILPKLADLSVSAEELDSFLGALEKELKMHSLVEAEIFYPAFKDAVGQTEGCDLYFESIEKHHVVDLLLPELKPLDRACDAFRAKARVLRELIEHHAEEEEREMFEKARALLGDLVLQDLGDRIQRRKIALDREWEGDAAGTASAVPRAADKYGDSSPRGRRAELSREEERR